MPQIFASILLLSTILAIYPLILVWTLCTKICHLVAAPSLELALQLAFVEIPMLFVTLGAIFTLEAFLKYITKRWPWVNYAAVGTTLVCMAGVVAADWSFVAHHQEEISEAIHVHLILLCYTMEEFFHHIRMYLQNERTAPDFYLVSRCLVDTINTTWAAI